MRSMQFFRIVIGVLLLLPVSMVQGQPIDTGTRRELFVDDHLLESIDKSVTFHLHQPQPQEVVLVTSHPWEGNTCAYYTIFRDGDLFRMYYRGSHYDTKTRKATHPEVTCYAESKDGIHWTKPDLGICEFQGSKKNNIVWDQVGTHNFTPFIDTNPDCPKEGRYKAIARGLPKAKRGLYVFQSADGLHWKQLKDQPVITTGAFDSQNLAFWDSSAKVYRAYYRHFRNGVREIMTCTSKDFINWSKPEFLKYTNNPPKRHLYTNAVMPYERAPHLLVGFPTQYFPERKSQVEPTFMTSRDGISFKRWAEPVIPSSAPKDRDGNRSNYMAWGMVKLPDHDNEYSVYGTEAYYTGPDSRIRRFSYRVDGFVSLRAGEKSGVVTTKPITFAGDQLSINADTKKNGKVRVALLDAEGNAIPGFTLNDCQPFTGDATDHIVRWRSEKSLAKWQNRPVHLQFELTNCDLFAFQFQNSK